ncbi:UNVERIFIED_CONTAM: hypothetical protein Sradi_5442800 [Sesamum radiatum]|uniref:Protein ABIL5 n=1 Tax=Sesamum radiatum TaxID=300843 RepID=A0AAW2L8W3_SESRA
MEKMRRREIEEDSNIALVDQNAQVLEKSVQELRKLRSQVYDAADYCETSFLNTPNKTIVVETTKDYISRAVAAVVDHLGGISANLEYSLRNTHSIPQTEHHIDMLRLRIGSWQQHSHKLALERFYMTADFSRHHCRYILPPSKDSEMKNVESRCTNREVEADDEKRNEFETEEPLFLHTYNCKPSLQVDNSKMDMVKNNELLPPGSPKAETQHDDDKSESDAEQRHHITTYSAWACQTYSYLIRRMSILLPHHVVERGPRGKGRWGWKPQAFLHLCSAKAKTPRRRGMGTV